MPCIPNLSIGQPPRGPWVVSPQVHDDKSVTFRYLAPSANEVMLSAQFLKERVAMTKDTLGIWSTTVGPVPPDIYPSIKGSTGSLVVYTPPAYDKDKAAQYPVFYLISGTTDTEETWFKVGKTNLILDNLIAQGKARPMIIVMPYGNPAARIAEQTGDQKPDDPMRGSEEATARAKMFEDDLMQHIIPYVDENYRTVKDRESRAIGVFPAEAGKHCGRLLPT